MMKFTHNPFSCFLMLLLLQAGCYSVNVVETEAEEGFDLSRYNTFNFYTPDQEPVSPAYEEGMELLKEAIAEELQDKGLSYSSEPDLLVNIGVVVEEKTQTRETNVMDAPIYIGQRRYSWKSEEVVTNRYQLGTATIHLVDRDDNKLVWRGVAEGIIPENKEKLKETIEKGVEALFDRL